MDWTHAERLARRQHGLVTLRQLHALGVGRHAAAWAVTDRQLVPVRPGVFRFAGVPVSQDQAWLAAVLAARGDAVLSHRSAAAAWGFRHFDVPEGIDLLVAGASRPRMAGVRGHTTLVLPREHRTSMRDIPITTAERTLLDVCDALPLRQMGRVLDDALRRKLARLPRLVRTFDEAPVSGRRPSGPMADLLRTRLPGFDPGGSGAELDVMRILRRAGITPLPKQQHRVRVEGRTYILDYCWPQTRHVIEFDGTGGHNTDSARHDDRERLRRLQRAAYIVWPVTEVTPHAELVAIGLEATGQTG
jgi:hypothetical protein